MKIAACLALVFASFALAADAPQLSREAEELYRKSERAILQIDVVDTRSGAKTSYGTGFRVQPGGLVITNYHVVSTLVFHPGNYRVVARGPDKQESIVTVVDIDVVNDLALLSAPAAPGDMLPLRSAPLENGASICSLGFPLDLGLTVVEGTFNGLTTDLHERYHFTGSLNPGMSGGPALTANGEVMGVNVATMGNQVSFLVPIGFARKLVDAHTGPKALATPDDLILRVRDQLVAHQQHFVGQLLETTYPTVPLGPYRVPGKIAGYMKTWGQSSDDPKLLYDVSRYTGNMNDEIYVLSDQHTSYLSLAHTLLSSKQLDTFRFYNMYESYFSRDAAAGGGSQEDLTSYASTTRFVEVNGITWRAALCLRAYKKLPGLYDAVLRAGTLMEPKRGLVTTLVMSGVSYENALKLARKHLEAITWKP